MNNLGSQRANRRTLQVNSSPPKMLRVLQINLNKLEQAHMELINNLKGDNWDVVLVQEPHVTAFCAIRTPTRFRPVFPDDRGRNGALVRAVIWVSTSLETRSWKILNVPNTNDITAIQLSGDHGLLTIFNIYNDCTNSNTEVALCAYLRNQASVILPDDRARMMWAGDFNRHHPLWDRDEDMHLFTSQTARAAEKLLRMLADYSMGMALLKGIPTLQHMRLKRYSRPDNVFCTPSLMGDVSKCEVVPDLRPPCTDHFPIATFLSLTQSRALIATNLNFRDTDWDQYRKELAKNLGCLPKPAPITTEEQIDRAASSLSTAIQSATTSCVKHAKPRPDAKRWWNSDLKKLQKRINRPRTDSYKFRALTDHPVHRELRELSNHYGDKIIHAKCQHWADYLEEMKANEIWNANKYLRDPVGDGGSPRIPTLKVTAADGSISEINDGQEKANAFTNIFFPPPPVTLTVPVNYGYPQPLPEPALITRDQIERQIQRLSPYKAYGPDEIPNIVLQRCADLILDHLLFIYRAILQLGKYYDLWRESTSMVLRKPGKPSYDVPKAYRPVVLLSTLAKVLTAIVAEDISRLVEEHQLLPQTHFGGRPGRSTTDALHYLVQQVKEAWRKGRVASVLFLDVEGAFPNAVTARLIHNLKRRRIPSTYVKFIEQLLTGRRTRLKFDDFVSESFSILNGIGQGDPLSMILYILYNADLLEIIGDKEFGDSLGFVDDIAIVAFGDSFEDTIGRLEHTIEKDGGGIAWSIDHNSRFEISKSVVMNLTR